MRAVIVIAAALLATPIAAQNPPPPGQPRTREQPTRQAPTIVAEPVALCIAGFDADQDGIVTRSELIAGAARSFASVANGAKDIGYIGYSDWARRWLGDPNALPNPFDVDADRDNRITQAELAGALLFEFDRLDKDRDGKLTRTELVTVRATAFGDDGDRRGKRGRGGPPPRQ